MKDINEWIEDTSPTHRLFLTQQMFEPLLRQHAIENGAVLRFNTELADFQHDQEGVTALIRSVETGEKQFVRAKYMVACDGNRSPVPEKLGIKSQGHGLLSHSLTIYFDANLGKFVKDKYNGVIYVDNEHIRGFFRLDKTGREGFLVVNTVGKKGTEESSILRLVLPTRGQGKCFALLSAQTSNSGSRISRPGMPNVTLLSTSTMEKLSSQETQLTL